MSMEIAVRVVDEDGRPERSITVTLDFGLWNGQLSEYTDSERLGGV